MAGDLLEARGAAQLAGERPLGAAPLGQQADHVGRDPDRGGGVDQGVADGLLDPVAGVGAEPGAELGVELLGGADQAEVPLADEVVQGHPAALVVAGDPHDQPEVGRDHPGAGVLVAAGDRLGQPSLVGGREQRHFVDVVEVGLKIVRNAAVHRMGARHERSPGPGRCFVVRLGYVKRSSADAPGEGAETWRRLRKPPCVCLASIASNPGRSNASLVAIARSNRTSLFDFFGGTRVAPAYPHAVAPGQLLRIGSRLA
ncbi:hypothetical protein VT85_24310 [Planctomyces sp. SH-PL62]|nr:hypothetical protein VT85_24310 [Planctomyces sp. SH-PL62]